MADDARLYRCAKCGAALGVILRGKNKRRAQLNVFRVPVLPGEVSANLREASAYVVTDLKEGSVTCGWCGAARAWLVSEAMIDELIERRRKRTFGLG